MSPKGKFTEKLSAFGAPTDDKRANTGDETMRVARRSTGFR